MLDGSSHNSPVALPHHVTSDTFICLSEPQFSHLVTGIGEMWCMSLKIPSKSKILWPGESYKVFLKPLKNSHLEGIFMQ